jgi:hypothetical protein
MKKLSMICGIVLTFALVVSPAFADMALQLNLDGDDSAFETELTVVVGDPFQVDVWLTNVTYSALCVTVDYSFAWDTTSLDCSATPSKGDDWDVNIVYDIDATAGLAQVGVSSSGGFNPSDGPDGISTLLQSFTCTCLAEGDDAFGASISGLESVGFATAPFSVTTVTPVDATAHQVPPICLCDVDPASPPKIEVTGSQTFTASQVDPADCGNAPNWNWMIYNTGPSPDCACAVSGECYLDTATGCLAGDATCDIVAQDVTELSNCTIMAADLNNWQGAYMASAPVYCLSSILIEPPPACETKIYRGGVCGEAEEIDTVYNRPGRRGLAMTCCEPETFCVCSNCYADYPFVEFHWSATVVEGEAIGFTLTPSIGEETMLDVDCPSTLDPVTIEVCVEAKEFGEPLAPTPDCVYVTVGKVVVGVGTTYANIDTQTTDLQLSLWNPENHVRAIQVDICECEDGEDNLICTECVVDEDRAPEFVCSANEQANGCCRVVLYNTEPDDLLQQCGLGDDCGVAMIKFDVLDEMSTKDEVCLCPDNILVSDQFNEYLCAPPKCGVIMFRICGDVYPQDCYECESCGDGVVDLFDILEEIDIILGIQTASLCQKMPYHGDVPLGMPPYCGDPAGVTPPNCETDGVIDIFDALVIIDKALSRLNCCDYCMYGQIY